MIILGLLDLKKISANDFDAEALALEAIDFCELKESALTIYMFGSAARGQMSPQSDIDLLVIFENSGELQKAQRRVLQRPFLKWPIDWIFKTKVEFDQRSEVGGVCFIARNQGKRLL